MVELTPIEQSVLQAMQELGATKDTVIKTADDITKKSNRPKGLVTNALVSLSQKGSDKKSRKGKGGRLLRN